MNKDNEIARLWEHKKVDAQTIQEQSDLIEELKAKLAEQPKQIVDKIKDFVYNNYIYVEETDLRVIKYDLLYKFLDNLLKEMKSE